MASFHPLFSTIATLYTLIFLYFPTIITFSPVLISASVLLLFLLKLGVDQRISQEERTKEPEPGNPSLPFSNNVSYHDDHSIKCEMDDPVDPDPKPDPVIDCGTKASCETDSKTCSDTNCFIEPDREKCSGHDPNPDPSPFYGKCFMQWNVRAPFEVIYNDDCTNCDMDSVVDPNMKPDPVPDCFNEYNVHDPDFDPAPEPDPRPFHGNCFVEWNVRAPLEVIYEAYEGEEEEEDREELLGVMERYTSLSMYKQQQQIQCDSLLSMYNQQQHTQCNNVSSKYKRQQQQIQCNDASLSMNKQQQQQQTQYDVSLSMYYPETDTDSTSSDGDSPENVCFRWDEEDKEGLIEIELDCKRNSEVEEENLIEIDLGFYMS